MRVVVEFLAVAWAMLRLHGQRCGCMGNAASFDIDQTASSLTLSGEILGLPLSGQGGGAGETTSVDGAIKVSGDSLASRSI